MYDFNSISNRLLRVSFEEYSGVLCKFLNFIDNTEIISQYIADCVVHNFDVKAEVNEVAQSYGKYIFSTGGTDKEEVSNIYQILKYIAENKIEIHVGISWGYSSSNKYQDKVKEFNHRFVLILIQHIETFLTKVGIDMGMDETSKYLITVEKGQVNIANDSSTINATINNGLVASELEMIMKTIRDLLTEDIPKEERELIEDNIEVMEEELNKENPRRGFIKAAWQGIKLAVANIPNAIEIAENINKLGELIRHWID